MRPAGPSNRCPSRSEGATYAAKIGRMDAAIDWTLDAFAIDRRVRAFDPSPGAFTVIGAEALKIWRVEPSSAPAAGAAPGSVVAAARDGIVVACGTGLVRIVELQPSGRRRMSAAQFLAGHRLAPGDRLAALAA